MSSLVAYINKHATVMRFMAAIIATVISLTVYALTNFATKDEVVKQAAQVKQFEDYRLDRLEMKVDKLDDKMDLLISRRK